MGLRGVLISFQIHAMILLRILARGLSARIIRKRSAVIQRACKPLVFILIFSSYLSLSDLMFCQCLQ